MPGAEKEQPKIKRRKAKGCSHTTEEISVETKSRRSKVHLHNTQVKQNGVETKEGAIIRAYSSRPECTILKQEMKGEESCSLDLKW